jgi:hypothetical protein
MSAISYVDGVRLVKLAKPDYRIDKDRCAAEVVRTLEGLSIVGQCRRFSPDSLLCWQHAGRTP